MNDIQASAEQLLHPPQPSKTKEFAQLGYLQSFDAVAEEDFACLVYKETKAKSGEWKIKIDLNGKRTSVINPDASSLRKAISEAAVAGMDHILVGYNIEPTDDDPTLVENRLHFNEDYQPEYLEIRMVTRSPDGSPDDEKQLKVDWPSEGNDAGERLLALPQATSSKGIEELAYVTSYDVIANADYAYLAYKKTDKKTGKWELKIKGKSTADTSIDPEDDDLPKKMADAAKEGRDHITEGFRIQPRENDPRRVENRIYFDDAFTPTAVEILVVTRNPDGSPTDEQVARFDWPA